MQLEGGEQMEQYPTSDKSKLLFAAPGGALLGAVTGGRYRSLRAFRGAGGT